MAVTGPAPPASQPKSFLVLFFKKERLPLLLCPLWPHAYGLIAVCQ
jgi:hypothetical protein